MSRNSYEQQEEFILIERSPTAEEYLMLREAVGWGEKSFESTETGLRNSLYSVCALRGNEIVGCGRVVGDGGIYFYIQDIIVLPEFQGKGLGRRIMDAVMDYLEANTHPGAFVGLMAAEGASMFYEQYGFTERAPDRPGMFMIWGK